MPRACAPGFGVAGWLLVYGALPRSLRGAAHRPHSSLTAAKSNRNASRPKKKTAWAGVVQAAKALLRGQRLAPDSASEGSTFIRACSAMFDFFVPAPEVKTLLRGARTSHHFGAEADDGSKCPTSDDGELPDLADARYCWASILPIPSKARCVPPVIWPSNVLFWHAIHPTAGFKGTGE